MIMMMIMMMMMMIAIGDNMFLHEWLIMYLSSDAIDELKNVVVMALAWCQ